MKLSFVSALIYWVGFIPNIECLLDIIILYILEGLAWCAGLDEIIISDIIVLSCVW